jgi:bifunctional UDP-N-acetylglucosamine pyrophosphorylase/glucosamine-1-phosphate N-acetyltransferase
MAHESLILAAGLGTRMHSGLPKALHPVCGRPMIRWVFEACRQATGKAPYVVIGPDMEAIREVVPEAAGFVIQNERLGTGHAVLQARQALEGRCDRLLVTSVDMALLTGESLHRLTEEPTDGASVLTMLTLTADRSRGFGRIIRDAKGRIKEIVEESHATPDQLQVNEFNVGAYSFATTWLWDSLARLPISPKGEYYLTDLVGMAVSEGRGLSSIALSDVSQGIGINTQEHLAEAESVLRHRINRDWMLRGVRMIDPATTYVGPDVEIGADTVIQPNTHLEGRTIVGDRCRLGPSTIVRGSTLGSDCRVEASVIEGATLEDDVSVGPFAHLRQGAYLCQGVHMGNFGEVKNSRLGPGVKMGHFSYIGDANLGDRVNIGAGTITCNFGRNGVKNHTEVGADVFIGSDSLLVAPLRIGRGAATGAGSVVTKDVPEKSLAVGVPARVVRRLDNDD